MSDLNEDFLEVDNRIPGQNYVCLSFVSPEKVMKDKEIFYVTKFLHHIFNDQSKSSKEVREKLADNKNITYNNISELYNDWKFGKNKDLELEFSELNDYRTSMRGVKVRGTYETLREAKRRAQMLQKRDRSFHVFVGQVGYWLPWDPEADDIEDQEYQESELNNLMKKYQENADNRDYLYDEERKEKIKKAKEEVRRRKQEAEALRKEENIERTPLRLDSEDVSREKIGELREILNEVDENVYETEKMKIDNSKKMDDKDKIEDITNNLEEDISNEYQNDIESTLKNFKVDNMTNLDKPDPWLERKMREEDEKRAREQESAMATSE